MSRLAFPDRMMAVGAFFQADPARSGAAGNGAAAGRFLAAVAGSAYPCQAPPLRG